MRPPAVLKRGVVELSGKKPACCSRRDLAIAHITLDPRSICDLVIPRAVGVCRVTRPLCGGGAFRPPMISETTGPISKP